MAGLPAEAGRHQEERKGPRVGAPAAAIDGFLQGPAGVTLARMRRGATPARANSISPCITARGPRHRRRAGRNRCRSCIAQTCPGPNPCAGGLATGALGAAAARHRLSSGRRGRAVRLRRRESGSTTHGPSLPVARVRSTSGATTIMTTALRKAHVVLDRGGAQGDHLRGVKRQPSSHRPGDDPGRGAAGRSGRPGGMAGGAGRPDRRRVHGRAGRDSADLHAHASEVFFPA